MATMEETLAGTINIGLASITATKMLKAVETSAKPKKGAKFKL